MQKIKFGLEPNDLDADLSNTLGYESDQEQERFGRCVKNRRQVGMSSESGVGKLSRSSTLRSRQLLKDDGTLNDEGSYAEAENQYEVGPPRDMNRVLETAESNSMPMPANMGSEESDEAMDGKDEENISEEDEMVDDNKLHFEENIKVKNKEKTRKDQNSNSLRKKKLRKVKRSRKEANSASHISRNLSFEYSGGESETENSKSATVNFKKSQK